MSTQTKKPEFTGYMLSPEVDPAKNTRIAGFNHDAAKTNPTLIFAVPDPKGGIVLQTMTLTQVEKRQIDIYTRIVESGGHDERLNAAADMFLEAIEKTKLGKVKPWSGPLEGLKHKLMTVGTKAPAKTGQEP
jgi:hypothetical protein